jgi:hypothetical protein
MKRPRLTVARLAVLLALLVAACAATACASLGARPDGDRLARARRSPQWDGSGFADPQPIWIDVGGALRGALFGKTAPAVAPIGPLPIVHDGAALAQPPASGLRVTWFGHSSALVVIDGVRVLVDPIWSERASPFDWIGPRRWFDPPLPLAGLPPLDAVVNSHDHYDHLDYGTIRALRATGARFVVPLGVGAHLVRWGIAESRIVELDWRERTSAGALTRGECRRAATAPCGPATRWWGRSTAPGSRATPASTPISSASAPSWDPSTSRSSRPANTTRTGPISTSAPSRRWRRTCACAGGRSCRCTGRSSDWRSTAGRSRSSACRRRRAAAA